MRIESVSAILSREENQQPATKETPVPHPNVSEAAAGSEMAIPERALKVRRETDDRNNTVYRLVDDKTGEVVNQVPSRQVLNVEQSIEELIQDEMLNPKLNVRS